MGSKWETVRLGDLTKWSSGGTPNKSEDSYWNGTIPWISASSMEGHLYSDSKLKITEDGLINGSRLAPANSILLLVRGSILHQKIQVGLATKAVAFNQDVKCLIVNNDMIDPWYLLLWFKAKEQDLLKIVESTGIGAGKLDTKLLMDYPVEIPP
ncbi:TPA: restriction endonuclease subunit S, partial [Escherichia coli]